MKYVEIKNQSNHTILGTKIGYANSPLSRFFGLLKKTHLDNGEGILLIPCNSIHMFFMKFPIDVVFLDRKYRVLKTIENLKPWKISPVVFKAQSVLELPVGSIEKNQIKENDILELTFI